MCNGARGHGCWYGVTIDGPTACGLRIHAGNAIESLNRGAAMEVEFLNHLSANPGNKIMARFEFELVDQQLRINSVATGFGGPPDKDAVEFLAVATSICDAI